MKKVNIFLFAAHHTSENIAAQRFKSLVKYLDPAIYNIYVFSRLVDRQFQPEPSIDRDNVIVHEVDGDCVGSQASRLVVSLMFLSAFFAKLPFFFASNKLATAHKSWMVNALLKAEPICRDRLAKGENCFVVGTYSPIDALIAARCLSIQYGLPHLLDFRDGFVFESLGRKGFVASLLRSAIERRITDAATIITSVSTALVEDFRLRYPHLEINLLPNGYDPFEFISKCSETLSTEADEIMNGIPKNRLIIGHFGRVSESDKSRLEALKYFIDSLNVADHLRDKIHVMFVGRLNSIEVTLIESLKFTHCIIPSVARSVALELMQQCNVLLLITGNGVGCATGKLFEYMATGHYIICFSVVKNEAAKILEETAAGKTILVNDHKSSLALFQEITNVQHECIEMSRDISMYSRKNQAAILSGWIQRAFL